MRHLAALIPVVLSASAAHAQFQITWYTIDGGGGTASGGVFSLTSTVGQPDAAAAAVGTPFECSGGFWGGSGSTAVCYPNCDGSTIVPILTANDFQCFLNAFAGNGSYANCDSSSVAPILTANDFQCFLNAYASGCP